MKKIMIALLLTVSFALNAQDKNARASLEVDGVCEMCKARIEKAATKTPGVKSAIWSIETHELKLIFDERKTSLKDVQKNIVEAGHDTKDMKATDEAYQSLHACCKYRDSGVKDDHK